jgi:hypothetical protein
MTPEVQQAHARHILQTGPGADDKPALFNVDHHTNLAMNLDNTDDSILTVNDTNQHEMAVHTAESTKDQMNTVADMVINVEIVKSKDYNAVNQTPDGVVMNDHIEAVQNEGVKYLKSRVDDL